MTITVPVGIKRQIAFGLLLTGSALAQPVQPLPPQSFPVADALAAAPAIVIQNRGLVARIAPPGPAGFYRGTRFDQAGVVTSLKQGTREFYGPWFERTAPDVLDYVIAADGAVVAGPDSAISGPVEEFAPLGFAPQPGSFVKIGVGLLRQPDTKPYDHYRHYEIVDGGTWTIAAAKDRIRFTQTLAGGGYGYVYEKTLRLDGSRLLIEHVLKNTGTQTIITTVYDHNFLRLAPGNAGITVTFPFAVAAATPPDPGLIAIAGNTLTYLRPFAEKERVSFPLTGFGATSSDYDFTITDKSGAGLRVQGDQPLVKLNIFSIDRVQAVEPYIAIDLAPAAQKRWRYTYTYRAL